MNESRLGRNLNDLLSGSLNMKNLGKTAQSKEGIQDISVDKIQRGRFQPRKDMDEEALTDLANSIKAQGLLQPIVIRAVENGMYEVIAGERRWRATQKLQLKTIPAVIKEVDDETAAALALIENIQRENLNPMEEAEAINRMLEEWSMTHQEVADVLGKSRVVVSNLVRLMGLHPEVQTFLSTRKLDMGHAKVLLTLESEQQLLAAQKVVEKQLSVRETENVVKQLQESKNIEIKEKDEKLAALLPHMEKRQKRLSEYLGAKVKIQHTAKGKGKLVIHYTSLEELEDILDNFDA